MEQIITQLHVSLKEAVLLFVLTGALIAAMTYGVKQFHLQVFGKKMSGLAIHGVLFVLSNMAVISAHLALLIPILKGSQYAIYVPALMGIAATLREAQQSPLVQSLLNVFSDAKIGRNLKETAGVPVAATADQAIQPIMPIFTPLQYQSTVAAQPNLQMQPNQAFINNGM